MIAARLLSWQLCWEGGNGVSRCCKENETALFARALAASLLFVRCQDKSPSYASYSLTAIS